MNINWYPGHMTKSKRMIEENIGLMDAVIYILDSRAPYSCLNPDFETIIGNRPVLYILNKADLADDKQTDAWIAFFKRSGSPVLKTVGTSSSGAGNIGKIIENVCAETLKKYQSKGVRKTLRAMVLGVPNAGKSTFINSVGRAVKTVTGNRPGVTRGKQWVRVSDFLELLDTPGTLYPKLSDQRVAKNLAFIGSIRDEVLDIEELAGNLLDDLIEIAPENLIARYKLKNEKAVGILNADDILSAVALSRGFIIRGGAPDHARTASAVVDDFRKGRIGRITLEKAGNYD